ncbi:MAG TPA: TonB-dependent receptor [Polyangia bacterium]|nr:TonB-dependent receptor [Polyangia bacterium]
MLAAVLIQASAHGAEDAGSEAAAVTNAGPADGAASAVPDAAPARLPAGPPPPQAGPLPPPVEATAAPRDARYRTTVTAPVPPAVAPREDRAAAASVVIPSDSPRAYDDLGSLLLQVPGVTVMRTGSSQAFTSLTLRGSNPDQVQIYVDGVPLDIAEGGGVDVSALPLGDVERVEVYRGTSPLAFGESALGGIVSITTRTPGVPRVSARAGAGSFGTAFGDVSAGGGIGRLRLYLGAHLFSSQGDYPLHYQRLPYDPSSVVDGVRQNDDTLEANGVLRAELPLEGRRTVGLELMGFARAEGLPGTIPNPALHARFHTNRGIAILRYGSRDDLGPGGRVSVEAFVSSERDRLLDPDAEVQTQRDFFFHETTLSIGTTVHATRPLSDWARAAAILGARRETYTPDDETDAADSGIPARRLIGVAGAELTLSLRRLELEVIPSARVEGMDDRVTGVDTNGQPVPAGPSLARLLPTYRLGLVRPLSPTVTLKANVGQYHHAPSFLELYGDGTQRLLGNPALVPESGTNADLALWIDHPGGRVSAASRTTLFGAAVDDLIYWQLTSNGPSRAENLSRARVYGLEQELQLAIGRHVRIVAQGTYLVALDEGDTPSSQGRQIPHHPRLAGYGRPELVRLALPRGIELGAYADAAILAGAYDDPSNRTRIPTQALIGAGASLSRPRSRLRLAVSALNLTDLLSTWNFSNLPLPGRTILVSLAYDSALGADGDASSIQPFGNP